MKYKFLLLAFALSCTTNLFSQTKAEQTKIDLVKQLIKGFNDNQIDATVNDLFDIPEKETFIAQIKLLKPQIGNIESTENFEFKGSLTLCDLKLSTRIILTSQVSFDDKNKMNGWYIKPKVITNITYPELSAELNIDDIVKSYVESSETAALSIGVYKDGVISYHNYGTKSPQSTDVPTKASVYEIGSISKTFTATIFAYMIEQGKVKLTDPVTKYLPDNCKNLKGIQLVHLATHNSGLPRLPENYTTGEFNPIDPYKNYNETLLLAYLATAKPKSTPGATFEYSNLGSGLLAYILTKESGMSYLELLRKVITKPLQMSSTSVNLDSELSVQLLPGHFEGMKPTPHWTWNNSTMTGAGGIVSSAEDMMKYMSAQIESRNSDLDVPILLSHQIHYKESKNKNTGLAWFQNYNDDYLRIWHNGATYGFHSYMGFCKKQKVGVVVLSNASVSLDEMSVLILDLLVQESKGE